MERVRDLGRRGLGAVVDLEEASEHVGRHAEVRIMVGAQANEAGALVMTRAGHGGIELLDALDVLTVAAEPLGDDVPANLALGGPERRPVKLELVGSSIVQVPSANTITVGGNRSRAAVCISIDVEAGRAVTGDAHDLALGAASLAPRRVPAVDRVHGVGPEHRADRCARGAAYHNTIRVSIRAGASTRAARTYKVLTAAQGSRPLPAAGPAHSV